MVWELFKDISLPSSTSYRAPFCMPNCRHPFQMWNSLNACSMQPPSQDLSCTAASGANVKWLVATLQSRRVKRCVKQRDVNADERIDCAVDVTSVRLSIIFNSKVIISRIYDLCVITTYLIRIVWRIMCSGCGCSMWWHMIGHSHCGRKA